MTGTARRAVPELEALARELELLRDRLAGGAAPVEEALRAVQASVEELRAAHELHRVRNDELERRAAQLEAERTRLRVVLDHLPVGVVLADADGRISWQTPDAVRLLGKLASIEDLRGVRVDGRPLPASHWPLSRAVRHGEACLGEQMEIEFEGERCILEAAAAPIFGPDGVRIGALMRVEDVTGRELRERAEREFIANAAHELRTPLTAIAAAVEVLQSGAKELPEERDRFLGHIERECVRLARLGRALLTLARAQARQEVPRVELVPLRPLLEELAAELRPPAAIDVRVECAESAGTASNADLLRQALWNIASNAVRYTKDGEVVLAVEELADDRIAIAVRDTGPGIPEEARSRVLDRFDRGTQVGTEGYGLGLGIAARSVEAAGGRLELSSGDRGTVVRVVLPAAQMLTEGDA